MSAEQTQTQIAAPAELRKRIHPQVGFSLQLRVATRRMGTRATLAAGKERQSIAILRSSLVEVGPNRLHSAREESISILR